MNSHSTKWSNLPESVNRSILYVPFTTDEVNQPFRDQAAIFDQVNAELDDKMANIDPNDPDFDSFELREEILEGLNKKDQKKAALEEGTLIELAQDMADGKMLRTFMQEVQKRLPAKDNHIDKDSIKIQWKKLNPEQQKEVLDKVVQKTPAILIRGQQPTHGDQPLPAGPLNLRPNDSIQITGHGHRTSKEIAVVTKLDVSIEIHASTVVQRMQEDLQDSALQVPLNVEGAAPRIKLNSCGSSGEFHQAFAHAAQEAEMQVDVHAYDYDVIITQPPEYVIGNHNKPNRYLELHDSVPTPAMLSAAAQAAQTLSEQGHETLLDAWAARPEAVQAALAEELEEKVSHAENVVTVAKLQLEQTQMDEPGNQKAIEVCKQELAEAEATLSALEQELREAEMRLEELQEEEHSPELDAMLTLNNCLKKREENKLEAVKSLSSDLVKNAPLNNLAAQLTEMAASLELNPKVKTLQFKASEHRPFISVRDALKNNHPQDQPYTVQQSQRKGSKVSSSSHMN